MNAISFYIFIIITILLPALFHHMYVIPNNILDFFYKPIDFGIQYKGNDLLGKTKTFRGLLVMTVGAGISALFVSRIINVQNIFVFNLFFVGAMAGLGYSIGEFPTSFIKRRLGYKSSEQRSGKIGVMMYVFEQIDSILGVYLLVLPTIRPEVFDFYSSRLAMLVIMGVFLKAILDVFLYKVGYKGKSDKPFFINLKNN